MITMAPYLFMSLVLFALGIFIVCTRKNAIGYLLGIELMLNSASINFVAFSHFHNSIDGHIVALFIIALAACESVIALAIVLGIYRNYKSIDTTCVAEMKE